MSDAGIEEVKKAILAELSDKEPERLLNSICPPEHVPCDIQKLEDLLVQERKLCSQSAFNEAFMGLLKENKIYVPKP